MAAYEVLLLNTAIPQIQAAQSGDTYLVPRDIAFSAALTLSAGTANGVPYLNGSKVVTTGSALTFDGSEIFKNSGGTIQNNDVRGSAAAGTRLSAGGTLGVDSFDLFQNAVGGYVFNRGNTPLIFGANNTERARITSGGDLLVGTTAAQSNAEKLSVYQADNSDGGVFYNANASQTRTNIVAFSSRNTTNNTFYVFSYYNVGAGASKFLIADSGDVTNTNGTYGTISDAKMKTDIVDAGSQWSDIKALRFRKFKMKNDPSGLVQLGVVAQEVELTSPGLVDEHADKDAEGNDLGTTTKSVKTSVLLMKAAVALQEAMARIETLEAEVAALKGV